MWLHAEMDKALSFAIAQFGGQTAFAKALGTTQSVVGNWLMRGRVPAERCPDIERLCEGKVLCEHLRPDIDWGYVRTHPRDSSIPDIHQTGAPTEPRWCNSSA